MLDFNFLKVDGVSADIGAWLPGRAQSLGLARFLGDAVCQNQGKYLEFEYMLGERHKRLKSAVHGDDPDPQDVRMLRDQVLSYVTDTLQHVSAMNFEMLRTRYADTRSSKTPPRVCIKQAREGRIVSLYSSPSRDYSSAEYPIESNTGFHAVHETGRFFVCNNIPKEAKKGLYHNPRLDSDVVRTYRRPMKNCVSRGSVDQPWCSCWRFGPQDHKPARWEYDCYKSTLIVPMTLINNDTSYEFRQSCLNNPPEDSRTIWGFLCLDHHQTGYFGSETDWRVGYVFADLLSLYYVAAYIHTKRSSTYRRANELIGEEA